MINPETLCPHLGSIAYFRREACRVLRVVTATGEAAMSRRFYGVVLNALRAPISVPPEAIFPLGLSQFRPRSSGGSAL